MPRWLVLGIFCAIVSAQPAAAQLNDAQKRRVILPTVRNATDCIARETLAQPGLVAAWRAGNISPMINVGWKACAAALVQIVNMHDELHGAGTGMPFVTGAYQNDLPRAIGVRIKDEMDRRIAFLDQAETAQRAEQARLKAERQQNTGRLERAAITLRDRVYECTGPQLQKLVASAESADVLATAAMTICRNEIDDAIEGRFSVMRAQGTQVNEQSRELLRKGVRESVITAAVQLKAGGSSAAAGAPPRGTVPASVDPSPPALTPSAGAGLPKEVRDCLTTFASARNGKFIDQKKLYEGMLELCRPEIETTARSAYLAKKDGDLATEREKALTEASVAAKAMIGMQ